MKSLQSLQTMSDLAVRLETLGVCSALPARLRNLDHLYPSSLEEEASAFSESGRTSNRSFLEQMQPVCDVRQLPYKRRGEKREFRQLSNAQRASMNWSNSNRIWREGVTDR